MPATRYTLPQPDPCLKNIPWRLVISDLDGTLLDSEGQISPANDQAIRRLAELGVGFTLATGRVEGMARKYARQLDIQLPVIACNGAIIRDARTLEILSSRRLPVAAAWAMVDGLIHQRIDFLCYSADIVYYWNDTGRVDVIRHFNAMADTPEQDRLPLVRMEDPAACLAQGGIIKIIAAVPDASAAATADTLLRHLRGLARVASQPGIFDIVAAGVSKGQALCDLAAMLGISAAEVVAIGDHDNDESMLAAAGLGIAMANASPAAVAASRFVTGTHEESGVAAALEHHFFCCAED